VGRENREYGPVMLAVRIAAPVAMMAPGQALADVALPLAFITVPLLPIIIILEVVVFRLTATQLFKTKLRSWKVATAVVLGNIVTSLLGIPLDFYRDKLENLLALGVAFVLSVLIEWGIFVPFFKKDEFGCLKLLLVSLIVNAISYALLIPLIPGILYPF